MRFQKADWRSTSPAVQTLNIKISELKPRWRGEAGARSYLGLVYEKPHESWHQHRARHAAFSPHLLLQKRERSGRRLFRYGHRVGLSHARHAGGGMKPTTGCELIRRLQRSSERSCRLLTEPVSIAGEYIRRFTPFLMSALFVVIHSRNLANHAEPGYLWIYVNHFCITQRVRKRAREKRSNDNNSYRLLYCDTQVKATHVSNLQSRSVNGNKYILCWFPLRCQEWRSAPLTGVNVGLQQTSPTASRRAVYVRVHPLRAAVIWRTMLWPKETTHLHNDQHKKEQMSPCLLFIWHVTTELNAMSR